MVRLLSKDLPRIRSAPSSLPFPTLSRIFSHLYRVLFSFSPRKSQTKTHNRALVKTITTIMPDTSYLPLLVLRAILYLFCIYSASFFTMLVLVTMIVACFRLLCDKKKGPPPRGSPKTTRGRSPTWNSILPLVGGIRGGWRGGHEARW